jgi:hypothetical protein
MRPAEHRVTVPAGLRESRELPCRVSDVLRRVRSLGRTRHRVELDSLTLFQRARYAQLGDGLCGAPGCRKIRARHGVAHRNAEHDVLLHAVFEAGLGGRLTGQKRGLGIGRG